MGKNKLRALVASGIFSLVLFCSTAKAVIPLLFGLGLVTGIETGLGTGAVISVGIHAAAAAVILWNVASGTPTPPNKPPVISVRLNDAPLPPPPGWAQSVDVTDFNPVPPTSVSPVATGDAAYSFDDDLGCGGRVTVSSSNLSEISSAILSAVNSGCHFPYGNNVYSIGNLNSSTGQMSFDCVEPRGYSCSFTATATVGGTPASCPAGTSKDSSGNCVVVDPKIVPLPADGTCQVVRTGNIFEGNSRDPDCNSNLAPENLSSDKSVLTFTSDDRKTQATVKANSDGSTTVSSTTDNGDGTSTTTVTNISPKPGSGGVNTPSVTGVSTSTVSTPDPGAGEGDGDGDGLEIPTDYNRESTQKSIFDQLKSTGTDIKKLSDGLDPNSIPKTNSDADALADAQKTLTDKIMSYLPSTWQELSEKGIFFVLPDTLVQLFSSTCSPWRFTIPFGGKTHVLDLTEFQDMIRSVAGFFVWIWTFQQLIRIFNPSPKD